MFILVLIIIIIAFLFAGSDLPQIGAEKLGGFSKHLTKTQPRQESRMIDGFECVKIPPGIYYLAAPKSARVIPIGRDPNSHMLGQQKSAGNFASYVIPDEEFYVIVDSPQNSRVLTDLAKKEISRPEILTKFSENPHDPEILTLFAEYVIPHELGGFVFDESRGNTKYILANRVFEKLTFAD